MAKYSVVLARTASATLAVGNVISNATTAHRLKLFRLHFGASGTPADTAFLVQLQHCTTAGTSTAVTPQKLDPGDRVAQATAGENHTVDPTLTANAIPFSQGCHTRNAINLFLGPGYEIVTPATASNGLALRTPTAGSLIAVNATLHYEE